MPEQRIERRDQRLRVDGAGPPRIGREKGGLAPALHADGDERALLDQFGQTLRGGRAEAEIVAQVLRGRHAERAGGDAQQFAVGIRFARCRHVEHFARQDAFGEVVDALEIAPAALRRDHAGPEQPFERALACRSSPTRSRCRVRRRDRARCWGRASPVRRRAP